MTTTMRDRILSGVIAAALAAPLLPATAFAQADPTYNWNQMVGQAIDAQRQAAAQSEEIDLERRERLDVEALTTKDCEDLLAAMDRSARQVIRESRPPDPGAVIARSTCYRELAQIRIPVYGGAVMAVVLQAVRRFMQQATCNAQNVFWRDILDKTEEGDFEGLGNYVFQEAAMTFETPDMPDGQLPAATFEQPAGGWGGVSNTILGAATSAATGAQSAIGALGNTLLNIIAGPGPAPAAPAPNMGETP